MLFAKDVIDVAPAGLSSHTELDVQTSSRAAGVLTTMGSLLLEERHDMPGQASTFAPPLADMDSRLLSRMYDAILKQGHQAARQ